MRKKKVCKKKKSQKNYLRKGKNFSACYGCGNHVYQFFEKNMNM